MKKEAVFLLLVFIMFIGACGAQQQTQALSEQNSSSGTPEFSATEVPLTASVEISNFRFNPDTVTIKAGGTITWTQKDSVPHIVYISDSIQSPPLNQGQTWNYTFDKPGEYAYKCGIHPSMKGKVIVK